MLCLICLNSLSSSCDQLPFQWLFSCVISLRCFVWIVIVEYQLWSTLIMPRNDCTWVFVVGGSMFRIVSILGWSAFNFMVLFWFFSIGYVCAYVKFFPAYDEIIFDAIREDLCYLWVCLVKCSWLAQNVIGGFFNPFFICYDYVAG